MSGCRESYSRLLDSRTSFLVGALRKLLDIGFQYTTKFIPDESGDWQFGMNVTEKGNLFIDKKLVIDLSTSPPPGEAFMGIGTAEVRAIVGDMKAGESYDFEIRLSNDGFSKRSPQFTCWGGFRLGGARVFDVENGIGEAVRLAKEADGEYSSIGLSLIHYTPL